MPGCGAGPATHTGQNPWIYRFDLNVGDYKFPAWSDCGDLRNMEGIVGQGENGTTSPPFTPVGKIFDSHSIVQVPVVDGVPLPADQFFDPSYGRTYSSEAVFE